MILGDGHVDVNRFASVVCQMWIEHIKCGIEIFLVIKYIFCWICFPCGFNKLLSIPFYCFEPTSTQYCVNALS